MNMLDNLHKECVPDVSSETSKTVNLSENDIDAICEKVFAKLTASEPVNKKEEPEKEEPEKEEE